MEINIQEIFDKYSQLCQFEEGDPEYLIDKEDFSLAIKEILEITLKEAADSAKAIDNTYSMGGWGMKGGSVSVSKESITSVINKVKF